MMNASTAMKPSVCDQNGRPLVFAPPLLTGFRGAPLALSSATKALKRKSSPRRNWAKRRAYAS
ncbi:MAG: hypothetical protein ACRCWF_15335 [Beijerinckiaceae bacterium]